MGLTVCILLAANCKLLQIGVVSQCDVRPGRLLLVPIIGVMMKEIAMQVHVFRGVGRVFAVTESSNMDTLPARYAPWTPVKTIEVVRGQLQPGLNVDECLDDIARYGIHVTDAHIRITEQAIA